MQLFNRRWDYFYQFVLEQARSSLFTNSFFLLGGTLVSAGAGFFYWLVAARLVPAEQIGVATAAIAGSQLIVSISDLGMGAALIHWAGRERQAPVNLINAVVPIYWVLGLSSAAVFVWGSPFWASGLVILRQDIFLLLFFMGFTVANCLFVAQDSAMLSVQRARFIFLRNLACNLPPLVLLVPASFVVEKNQLLFITYMLPNIVVGMSTSLWVLPRTFPGYRLFGQVQLATLFNFIPYGLNVHGANLLWASMNYLIPLIAINLLPASETGYFYISWTLLNFVLFIPRATTTALFVEGSQGKVSLELAAFRSLWFSWSLMVPLVVILWVGGPTILGLFGKDYIQISILQRLLLSTIPFSINSTYFIYLRVRQRLLFSTLFAALTAIVTITSVYTFSTAHGLVGLASGWSVGSMLVALFPISHVLLRLRLAPSHLSRPTNHRNQISIEPHEF